MRRGNFRALLLALPDISLVLASWGNFKVGKSVLTYLEHVLHIAEVAPAVLQVQASKLP